MKYDLHFRVNITPKCFFFSFIGALACTHTKWTHKLDFPTLDFPYVDFPQMQYPLSDNEDANRREEDRCLQLVREKIHEYNSKATPVAAAIVEPIQGEGGDRYATPYFFKQLQAILKQVLMLW